LARPWAIPGTPHLEHRIGGLEKAHITGNVSYDPENHQKMVQLRAQKVQNVAKDIPLQEVFGDPDGGELLVVGWGGTYGAITTAVENMRKQGHSVSSIHLKYLNPFPANLNDIFPKFKKILVAELNMGQLAFLLRAQYGISTLTLNKVKGKPFKVAEIEQKIQEILSNK
ncbi:MAG: 2-oxoglutarate ferredoxin oxidoreductase subunit alpha, partial [Planctomycetota bacterium]